MAYQKKYGNISVMIIYFSRNVALETMGFKTFVGGGRQDIWEPEGDIVGVLKKKARS